MSKTTDAAKDKVLFLDDMESRHKKFLQATSNLLSDFEIVRVYNAADAIKALNENKFYQVFLDHDLSEEDQMCEVGAQKTVAPTGMTVVDHILSMENPPTQAIVHSCNEPAAREMAKRLESHPGIQNVKRLAFPWLITFIEASSA